MDGRSHSPGDLTRDGQKVCWGCCFPFSLCVLVTQSCLTSDPKDCSSSVHGILQARILEWVAFPFSRGSSRLRDGTQVSCIAGGFFTVWATRGALPFPYFTLNNSLLKSTCVLFLSAHLPSYPYHLRRILSLTSSFLGAVMLPSERSV